MKLYGVSDGPPSFACRMVLKALDINYELVPVNYNVGEHLTDEYFKVNSRVQLNFVAFYYSFLFISTLISVVLF